MIAGTCTLSLKSLKEGASIGCEVERCKAQKECGISLCRAAKRCGAVGEAEDEREKGQCQHSRTTFRVRVGRCEKDGVGTRRDSAKAQRRLRGVSGVGHGGFERDQVERFSILERACA